MFSKISVCLNRSTNNLRLFVNQIRRHNSCHLGHCHSPEICEELFHMLKHGKHSPSVSSGNIYSFEIKYLVHQYQTDKLTKHEYHNNLYHLLSNSSHCGIDCRSSPNCCLKKINAVFKDD